MRSLLLDQGTWDLAIDTSGNIAVASDPYAMAQAAACACRLFANELYFDTVPGVPYFEEILGQAPPISLVKAYLVRAALRVPGVVSAQVFISEWSDRTIRGQVQISDANGNTSAAGF